MVNNIGKEEIIKTAKECLKSFKRIVKHEPYKIRGVFSSEVLLIISIAQYFGVKTIIESGRARGYSTKLFAEFFKKDPNFKIISIDSDKNSKDAKYGEKQLKDYKNIQLVYGDTNKIIKEYITDNCVVFIDGPKGDNALILAAKLINNDYVKAICIHDFHKNAFQRNIFEIIFTNTFFSDDKDFVEEFRFLDDKCQKALKDRGEAPYLRKGQKIESYASTVGVIFNGSDAVNQRVLLNYQEYLKQKDKIGIKKFIKEIFRRMLNIK